MGRNLPNGSRAFVELNFPGLPGAAAVKSLSKVKTGTAALFKWKVLEVQPTGKRFRKKKGHKDLSYTIVLRQRTSIGGADVYTVRVPVDPSVQSRQVYTYFRKNPLVAGIITPWGVSSFWATPPRRGGGFKFPTLPPSGGTGGGSQGNGGDGGFLPTGFDDIPRVIDKVGDLADKAGPIIDTARILIPILF